MITWQQWVEGPQDYPRAWQDFLATDAGKAGLEVLAARMVGERSNYAAGTNIIEARAITGAEDDGYRKCFRYVTELQLYVIEALKKRREEANQKVEGFEGSSLPPREDLMRKIQEDPIIAEHKRRQAKLAEQASAPSSFSPPK